MKIAVTGANGYFAWELIRQFSLEKDVEIVAIPFDAVLTKTDMPYENISFMNNDDIEADPCALKGVDVVIHTAFCRKSAGSLLVGSLRYMEKIVSTAIKSDVGGFINLSSQSVYGGENQTELPDEERQPDPNYLYALAKASSELLLKQAVSFSQSSMKFANFRLASMMGVSNDVPRNVLYKFICSALLGNDLTVQGGKQRFSFIDVSDAAGAVKRFCRLPFSEWETVYNLGPEKQVSITEMAEMVCRNVNALKGTNVTFSVQEEDIRLNAGMDSSHLYRTLGWKPELSFEETVSLTIRYITENS